MLLTQSFLSAIGLCSLLALAPGQPQRHARQPLRATPRAGSTQAPGGKTPLMQAVLKNDKTAFAAAMAAPGVNVNARDAYTSTALMMAVDNDRVEFVTALVAAGADVNARSLHNRSVLMHAAAPEVDNPGYKPLVKSSEDGKIYEPRPPNNHRPSNPKLVALLIKAGADCKARDSERNTALILYMLDGASDSNEEVLVSLLRCGVAVNAQGTDGKTALIFALQERRSPTAVAALLKAGAAVDLKDTHGETALFLAAHYGEPEDVAVLLKAGANPRVKNRYGQLAYEFAAENSSFEGSAELATLKAAASSRKRP